MIRARTPHLRLQQPPVVDDVLLQGTAFGTQRAAIDGMVRIAFHMHHGGRYILGPVADGVDDDAATHRAVRTSGTGLGGAGNLQFTGLRVGRRKVESKRRYQSPACGAAFRKVLRVGVMNPILLCG